MGADPRWEAGSLALRLTGRLPVEVVTIATPYAAYAELLGPHEVPSRCRVLGAHSHAVCPRRPCPFTEEDHRGSETPGASCEDMQPITG